MLLEFLFCKPPVVSSRNTPEVLDKNHKTNSINQLVEGILEEISDLIPVEISHYLKKFQELHCRWHSQRVFVRNSKWRFWRNFQLIPGKVCKGISSLFSSNPFLEQSSDKKSVRFSRRKLEKKILEELLRKHMRIYPEKFLK